MDKSVQEKMKKSHIIAILLIIIAVLNFLYTFGYQGEPMSQIEFLSRTFGSLGLGLISIFLLIKK